MIELRGDGTLAHRLQPLGVGVISAADAAQASRAPRRAQPLITLIDTPAAGPSATAATSRQLAADLQGAGRRGAPGAAGHAQRRRRGRGRRCARAARAPATSRSPTPTRPSRPGAPLELALAAGRPVSYVCSRDGALRRTPPRWPHSCFPDNGCSDRSCLAAGRGPARDRPPPAHRDASGHRRAGEGTSVIVALAVNDDRIERTIGQDWPSRSCPDAASSAIAGRLTRRPRRLAEHRAHRRRRADPAARVRPRRMPSSTSPCAVSTRRSAATPRRSTSRAAASRSRQVEAAARASTCASSSQLPDGPPMRALGRVVRAGQEPTRRASAWTESAAPTKIVSCATSATARFRRCALPEAMMAERTRTDKEEEGRRRRRKDDRQRLDLPAPAREGRHPPRPHARRVHRLHRRPRAQPHRRPGALRRRLARAGGRHRRQRRSSGAARSSSGVTS